MPGVIVRISVLTACGLFWLTGPLPAQTPRKIAVEWESGQPGGQVHIANGSLLSLRAADSRTDTTREGAFRSREQGPVRIELELSGAEPRYGSGAALVHIAAQTNPFSFFLRDVSAAQPILIPAYGVAVTDAQDPRTYRDIERDVRARGLQTRLEQVESEPEESFEAASAATRSLSCQTWLGLSRDIRIFAVGERMDFVEPRFHGSDVTFPESAGRPVRYNFLMGRGWGPLDKLTRRLEQGVLPILHGTLTDEDIRYDLTAFAALESSPLSSRTLRGTHFLVADGHGAGHMFTKEQQARYDSLLNQEMNQAEETVLFVRISAVNTAAVPRYAFFKNAYPTSVRGYKFDGAQGFGECGTDRVCVVSKLDGKPLQQEEAAVMLKPGESAEFEMYLPHRPISRERAAKLSGVRWDERHSECAGFWTEKLSAAARISVPEARINEMIRAGLLHLDLITYGTEPEGTLTATIGRYSAIGSESSPIIQFFDSMGWPDVARRSLWYFVEKQHDDGFMQNFGGYMLETGAALWSMGEHYRYTRDQEWVRRISPNIIKACEFLERWRRQNQRDELRGKGYGMLDGKTADPEDPYRSFMLNGYTYLGFARAAEMLRDVDAAQSRKWRAEAESLRGDIRTAAFDVMGRSPVIPLSNGNWSPTLAPWVEGRGPLMLLADGAKWFTHGAVPARDSLLGPLYLIFQEVIGPHEPAADFLLNVHNDLMTARNVAFSQPYYSRHPIAHLRRGEVKPFLKAYYNTVASLADRETYTFWEHFFGASPHKTHEEAWFLMQTRWMLYLEDGPVLQLLPGVPRAWLENGRHIQVNNAATYFGPVSVDVVSALDRGRIHAVIECRSDRKPATVELRIPHPQGRRATSVTGGTYDATSERVRIEAFNGRAEVTLTF